MFIDWSALRIFVRPGATDLRKQINGCSTLMHQEGKEMNDIPTGFFKRSPCWP